MKNEVSQNSDSAILEKKQQLCRQEAYSFQDFLDIIEILRSKDGCPWDREQTYDSLRPCIMEEAAELSAAIRIYKETGDYSNLTEELGDVLLQVVMQSQIAREEGIFTIEDVIGEVSSKMVRRHPHVFGTVNVENSSEVLKNWEQIKKVEKAGRKEEVVKMSDIPLELPALARAQKVLKKADKLDCTVPSYEGSQEELKSFVEDSVALQTMSVKEKEQYFGELLYHITNLARLSGVHAEQALSDVVAHKLEEYR